MALPFSTTAPGRGRTQESTAVVPDYVFILVFSESEPDREGECGPLHGSEPWLLGRGGPGNYVVFFRQLPGVEPPPRRGEACLGGETLSRLQAEVEVRPDGVHIWNLGGIPMYVDGVETSYAVALLGAKVHFENEVVLLVTLRPRVMPALREATVNHEFGTADGLGFVGESPGMWNARDAGALAAVMDDNVLLLAESGTGKELLAHAIHNGSKRAGKTMVVVNSTVVTESLSQQNLFGNLRGFPNSDTPQREGYFSQAHGSTLFLDEIGDCPKDLQKQLLRTLQSGEIQVLGEPLPRNVDVRTIGATDQGTENFEEAFDGRFPRRIFLPPLRERREDIVLIVRRIVVRYASRRPQLARLLRKWPSGDLYPRISPRLVNYLLGLYLTKNVRDLEALVTLAIDESAGDKVEMFSERVLSAIVEPKWGPESPSVRRALARLTPTVPLSGQQPSKPPSSPLSASSEKGAASSRREDPTREEMLATVEREWWNVRASAKALGISEPRMYRLMERYGIKRP